MTNTLHSMLRLSSAAAQAVEAAAENGVWAMETLGGQRVRRWVQLGSGHGVAASLGQNGLGRFVVSAASMGRGQPGWVTRRRALPLTSLLAPPPPRIYAGRATAGTRSRAGSGIS